MRFRAGRLLMYGCRGDVTERTREERVLRLGVTGTFSWTCNSIMYRSIFSYKHNTQHQSPGPRATVLSCQMTRAVKQHSVHPSQHMS